MAVPTTTAAGQPVTVIPTAAVQPDDLIVTAQTGQPVTDLPAISTAGEDPPISARIGQPVIITETGTFAGGDTVITSSLAGQEVVYIPAAGSGGGAGPDPEPPAFSPVDLAGLVRWYKASDYLGGGYADDAELTTNWLDNSTVGDPAIPEVTSRPVYKNTILAASAPSILFTDGFHHFDITEITTVAFTIIAFWKPLADAIIASSTNGNYQIRERNGSPTSRPYIYPNSPTEMLHVDANPTNVWHVRTWLRSAGGVPLFYYNKIQYAEDSLVTNSAPMKINTIGLFNGGPGNFHLGQILIFNVALSAEEIAQVYDYLALTYPGNLTP